MTMDYYGADLLFSSIIPFEFLTLPILWMVGENWAGPSRQNGAVNGDIDAEDGSTPPKASGWQSVKKSLAERMATFKLHILEGVLPLLYRTNLMLALGGYFINRFSRPMASMIQQYVSYRFGWPLSKVTTTKSATLKSLH
jgi:hypothetical protein